MLVLIEIQITFSGKSSPAAAFAFME